MDGHDFGSSSHMDFGHDFSSDCHSDCSQDLNHTTNDIYNTDDGLDDFRNNACTNNYDFQYDEQIEAITYNYSERQCIENLPYFQVEEKGGFWHNLFKGWW